MARLYNWLTDPQRNPKIFGSRLNDEFDQIIWSNTRLAKTANYTVANTDKAATIALGGSACYTLTFNAASGYDANFSVTVLNEDTATPRAKIIAISGLANFFLYPGQSVVVFNQNNVWSVQGKSRWRIPSGTTTIYTNQSLGNDSNDGLATGAGNAMATVQAAMIRISRDIDVAGNSVLVQMGANESGVGGVHLGVNGFFIGTGGGAAITLDGGGFTLDGGSSPAINLFFSYGFTVQNITLQGANCISLDHAQMRAGAGVVWGVTTGHQLTAFYESKLELNSASTIGGAPGLSFISVQYGSTAIFTGAITFNVNVAYPLSFVFAKNCGIAEFSNATIVLNGKTVTGTRWLSDSNAIVISATGVPNTYFPGNANGSATNGGLGL